MAPPPTPSGPPSPANPNPVAPLGSLIFAPLGNDGPLGPQVRGFGFLHDGSVDTVFRFLSGSVFTTRAPGTIPSLDPRTPPEFVRPIRAMKAAFPSPSQVSLQRRVVEAFLLAFDSNLAPIVGQQITLTRHNAAIAGPRIDLLVARADAHECDLVAKNRRDGFLYVGQGSFRISRAATKRISDPRLRATARLPGGEITYTCVPPGSGKRIGIDRDEDGILDSNDHRTGRSKQAAEGR